MSSRTPIRDQFRNPVLSPKQILKQVQDDKEKVRYYEATLFVIPTPELESIDAIGS